MLESLARQEGAPRFRVLVADNAQDRVEELQVANLAAHLGLNIAYLHAPAANVAVARNACLDHATADLIAFIDDDEIADSDWLAQLHQGLQSLDVVFGPVQAHYAGDAPPWLRHGDFLSKIPARRSDGSCATGHTANVLLRRRCIGTRRFDPALGNSGGEDTLFFALLERDGARLGYCPTARVHEPADAARTRLSWLSRRAFGSGQAHARMRLALGSSRLLLIPLATLKTLWCAMATVFTFWSAVRWRRHLLRASLHLGVTSTALGARDVRFYGGDSTSA